MTCGRVVVGGQNNDRMESRLQSKEEYEKHINITANCRVLPLIKKTQLAY